MIIVKTTDYKHLYCKIFGHHFNEKSSKFAIDLLYKNKSGLLLMTIGLLMTLASAHNIDFSKYNSYDCLYIANMCKTNFLGSSITDEYHIILYIKDLLSGTNGYDDLVFNRWLSDMKGLDITIEWEDFL